MDDKALPPENDENQVLQQSTFGDADKNEKPARGRPKTNKSTTQSVWSIKGIEHETRSKISTAAKRSGETIGAYVNRVLLDAANRDLSSKSRTEIGPTQDEINFQLLQRMDEISQRLEEVSQKPEAKHWLWKKIMR
jgi:hypothetical protein